LFELNPVGVLDLHWDKMAYWIMCKIILVPHRNYSISGLSWKFKICSKQIVP
jgi:hypothetical protein